MTEVRVDVGSSEDGPVKRLELDVLDQRNAAVLVHHHLSDVVTRWDVCVDATVKRTDFACGAAITALHVALQPSAPIATQAPPNTVGTDETPLLSPSATPPPIDLNKPQFGRYIITGDENGIVSIFGWDTVGDLETIQPIRSWEAANHKITAIDASSSLVAIGRRVCSSCASSTKLTY
jgi:hypothetical protein